jgi:hypothetical protein
MTLDPERVRQLRDSGNDGVILTLYMDISNEEYVAAGEPGDLVLAVESGYAKTLLDIVFALKHDGRIEELTDDAANAVMWLAQLGTDRQALLAPAMEALHDVKSRSGAAADPMAGYMERAAASEQAARERREAADN